MNVRLLTDIRFEIVHQTFIDGFSDYLAPLQPTQDQLREMFTRRGVDQSLSAGAFVNEDLVAFTFNALDEYQNLRTVYDAGSAVLPAYRRQGLSDAIFQFLLPQLKQAGAQQYLLEVIEKNIPALRLYEKIGFRFSRKFDVYVGTVSIQEDRTLFTLREIEPDWGYWQTIWDWEPSWQNSSESIRRSKKPRFIRGVFLKDRCIGYGIIYPESGDVPQFCIDPEFRGRGAGKFLLQSLQSLTSQPTRYINIDNASTSTVHLLERCGVPKFGTQLEMRMML